MGQGACLQWDTDSEQAEKPGHFSDQLREHKDHSHVVSAWGGVFWTGAQGGALQGKLS